MMLDSHTRSWRMTALSLISILALLCTGPVLANECLNLFPYDVKVDGLPKVCQASLKGKPRLYSCQDYRSGHNRYRVLYHGGNAPDAVLALHAKGRATILASRGQQGLRCPLRPPAGVPKYAQHFGLGVCSDQQDKPVACSIFAYAAARETHAHHYMVYYPHNAQEDLRIVDEDAGMNRDAMVAEIAYQLGIQLAHSRCCRAQALQYLAYAHSLFPRSEIYRHAYQRGRAMLAMQNI